MKVSDLIETTRHTEHRMGRKVGHYYSACLRGTALSARGTTREEAETALVDRIRERINFEGTQVLPVNDHDVIVVDSARSYQFWRRAGDAQSPFVAGSSVLIENAPRSARLHAAQLRVDMPRLGFDVLPTNDSSSWVEHGTYMASTLANMLATALGLPNNGPGTEGHAFAEPWARSCMFRINNNEYRIGDAATVLDIRRGTGAEIEFVDGTRNRTTILPPREAGQ